jgi:hypothetical protein
MHTEQYPSGPRRARDGGGEGCELVARQRGREEDADDAGVVAGRHATSSCRRTEYHTQSSISRNAVDTTAKRGPVVRGCGCTRAVGHVSDL